MTTAALLLAGFFVFVGAGTVYTACVQRYRRFKRNLRKARRRTGRTQWVTVPVQRQRRVAR